MSSEEASVWIVRPQDVGDDGISAFERMLDSEETERASKFRFESDRRSYIAAHGLRRTVLGDLLAVDPRSLVLSKLNSGEPKLIWPNEAGLFFSHAHTRDTVAFAATSRSPVGVDVEHVVDTQPDFDLLEPYVVLPEVSQRIAELGVNPARQFFFYWTALEAFWKAAGKGLSPENPRIRCEKNESGDFDVTLEGSVGGPHSGSQVSVARIHAPGNCMISLAQHYGHATAGRVDTSSFSSAGKPGKQSRLFQRVKRYNDSDLISHVSVQRQGSVRT